MIRFGRDICGDLVQASNREWLETNGLGAYASGTVAGLNTRGYHSLLTVPLKAPLKRALLISQIDEVITYNGKKFALGTHEYDSGRIEPQGFQYLESFEYDYCPAYYYRIEDQLLQKQIFMVYQQQLTWVIYRLLTKPKAKMTMTINPLLSFRSHHLQKRSRLFVNTHHDLDKQVIKILPDHQMPSLYIHHNADGYEHSSHWYNEVFYRKEKARILDCTEDLFTPGTLNFELVQNKYHYITLGTEALEKSDPRSAMEKEMNRRQELSDLLPAEDRFGRQLLRAADHFVVKRGEGLSIMAGYPWLADCGRDAMIACSGLLVTAKRYDQARLLLETYANYCSEGMLPNHFTEEHSEPMYNTVDAALWFFIAVDYYRNRTKDMAFIQDVCWPVMVKIINAYSQGTRFGIRMDTDGLVNLPEEGAQLTWMDAQVGDWVVTPRAGKAVDVNALWYNALCIMADYAEKSDRKEEREKYTRMAANTREGFCKCFWNESGGYLYDKIEDYQQDGSFRPNQLLAISLPYPLLETDKAEKLLKNVMTMLFTTFGCRTLDVNDEHYKGQYRGDILKREGAAFQGTVWPWLIGPLADAWRYVYGQTEETCEQINIFLEPFKLHMDNFGLGLISEMFDGNEPHQARGCIARAWNVAECLRLHLENNYPNL